MARLEQRAGSREREAGGEGALQVMREVGEGLLIPTDDQVAWAILRELYRLDIANMTPVQALVMLNEWQARLRSP